LLTSKELLQKYHETLSSPIDASDCSSGECVSMIFCSDWVKMMIIRSQEQSTDCSIEIEVSLPTCIIEPYLLSSNVNQSEARIFIDTTITHLEYLLRLQKIGFKLGIISTEGIWTAVLGMNKSVDEELFEALLPPSCL